MKKSLTTCKALTVGALTAVFGQISSIARRKKSLNIKRKTIFTCSPSVGGRERGRKRVKKQTPKHNEFMIFTIYGFRLLCFLERCPFSDKASSTIRKETSRFSWKNHMAREKVSSMSVKM
jgi:hypothetical protein